jgi:hypothetical protein
MPSPLTHYDVLKVARDAPPEVIRASYRALSQKFHPDRNPGDKKAAAVMARLNESYDILSDETKRARYDQWLSQQADPKAGESRPRAEAKPHPRPPSVQARSSTTNPTALSPMWTHVANFGVWYVVVACLVGSLVASELTSSTSREAVPVPVAVSAPAKPYVAPTIAPNGSPWPLTADYVQGYERLNTGGLSSVTVNNSENEADAFVKLFSLHRVLPQPVRTFFIPGRSSFTVSGLSAGRYDVRYMDLASGTMSRSESFELRETPTDGGIEYSTLTMTLYKVANGNMQTYPLSPAEF